MDLERRIGTVLCGKWTLERLLGSGGMAAVYVGVHKIGRREAIKILHPEIARVPELRARFEQEAMAVNRFVHPGAVEVRDIDVSDDGCPFLVMELLEGESLRARCHRIGPPSLPETLRIADDVLDVLAAAHAHGIVHRDVKPDNVFCLPDGRIKVLDFGVARVRQANAFRTRTGAAIGTVAYMPPEQAKGEDIDVRADVFAVGATMFRIIANRHVHEARSEAELIIQVMTQPAPLLGSVVPGAPPNVCAIVDRALQFERESRYATATSMQQDIRAVRGGRQPEPATVMLPVKAPVVPPARAPLASAPVAATPQTPVIAPASSHKTVAEQFTRWAATTVREKKLRRIALLFPMVGGVVLAVVFYLATRVDRDAPADPASGAPAALAEPPGPVAPPVATATARSRVTRAEVARSPRLAPAAEETARAAPDEASTRTLNCFLTNDCEETCDGKCNAGCMDESGCTIGAVHDSKVRCTGPERCEVSCAGKCKVQCKRGPCLVHCTPGFECELEDCPTDVEMCTPLLLACGTACPG